MTNTTPGYQVIPLTDAPSQQLNVTLGGQACIIKVYTKSINVPMRDPNTVASDPNPIYQNVNPVFLDLSVVPNTGGNAQLVVGGVICLNGVAIVRDAYFGFVGDLAVYDTQGSDDPYGVPNMLPPYDLQNPQQLALPRAAYGVPADTSTLGICLGLGTRFVLTYWPGAV